MQEIIPDSNASTALKFNCFLVKKKKEQNITDKNQQNQTRNTVTELCLGEDPLTWQSPRRNCDTPDSNV